MQGGKQIGRLCGESILQACFEYVFMNVPERCLTYVHVQERNATCKSIVRTVSSVQFMNCLFRLPKWQLCRFTFSKTWDLLVLLSISTLPLFCSAEYVAVEREREGSRMMFLEACRLSMNWTKSSLETIPLSNCLPPLPPFIILVGLCVGQRRGEERRGEERRGEERRGEERRGEERRGEERGGEGRGGEGRRGEERRGEGREGEGRRGGRRGEERGGEGRGGEGREGEEKRGEERRGEEERGGERRRGDQR